MWQEWVEASNTAFIILKSQIYFTSLKNVATSSDCQKESWGKGEIITLSLLQNLLELSLLRFLIPPAADSKNSKPHSPRLLKDENSLQIWTIQLGDKQVKYFLHTMLFWLGDKHCSLKGWGGVIRE